LKPKIIPSGVNIREVGLSIFSDGLATLARDMATKMKILEKKHVERKTVAGRIPVLDSLG
jgi:hypothetical protein